MRYITIGVALLTITAFVARDAASQDRSMRRQHMEKRIEKRFDRLDQNHDGVMTREELAHARAELAKHGPVRRALHRRRILRHAFRSMHEGDRTGFDTNHDGTLDSNERQQFRTARHQQLLHRFDGNGDNKLDRQERGQIRRSRRQEVLQRYDTDGDGKLSRTEVEAIRSARRQALLEKLDTDGDGRLSPEERRSIRKRRPLHRGDR